MALDNYLDGNITKSDAVGFGRSAVGMVAGKIAGPLDVGLAAVQGRIETEEELKKLSQQFGDLQAAAKKSGVLRRTVANLQARWEGRVTEALVGLGGAAAGAAVGSAIFPGLGTIGGLVVGGVSGMGGGFVADKIYNHFKPVPEQDAVQIAMTIDALRKKGTYIPPVVVSTLMLAMQGGTTGKQAENNLKQTFGTSDFNEALQIAMSNNKMAKLNSVLKVFENKVGGAFRVRLDPDAPETTPGEQVAEMINSGVISAKQIIADPKKVNSAYTRYLAMREFPDAHEVETPEVPPTPSRGRVMGKPSLQTA